MMIKYLIIDDEYVAHDIIKAYCDLLPNLQLAKHCYDALEAFEYLNANSVDLIFLDLNMPKLKGFDFLKTLSVPPKVIVTTAYKEYALEGYELNISDYLLKPFGFERFLGAVNKTFSAAMPQPIATTTTQGLPQRLFLKSNKKYIQVLVTDILFIEASGNYTKVVCINDTISIRQTFADVLTLLPKDQFLQVHKSFAVSINHIKSVEGNRIAIDTHAIPIGKHYKSNVMGLFG
jgi:DNA-binding LytR/AlgR family response regulator